MKARQGACTRGLTWIGVLPMGTQEALNELQKAHLEATQASEEVRDGAAEEIIERAQSCPSSPLKGVRARGASDSGPTTPAAMTPEAPRRQTISDRHQSPFLPTSLEKAKMLDGPASNSSLRTSMERTPPSRSPELAVDRRAHGEQTEEELLDDMDLGRLSLSHLSPASRALRLPLVHRGTEPALSSFRAKYLWRLRTSQPIDQGLQTANHPPGGHEEEEFVPRLFNAAADLLAEKRRLEGEFFSTVQSGDSFGERFLLLLDDEHVTSRKTAEAEAKFGLHSTRGASANAGHKGGLVLVLEGDDYVQMVAGTMRKMLAEAAKGDFLRSRLAIPPLERTLDDGKALAELSSTCTWLSRLDHKLQLELLMSATLRTMEEGELLAVQGEPARSFFMVLQGGLEARTVPATEVVAMQRQVGRLREKHQAGQALLLSSNSSSERAEVCGETLVAAYRPGDSLGEAPLRVPPTSATCHPVQSPGTKSTKAELDKMVRLLEARCKVLCQEAVKEVRDIDNGYLGHYFWG
ncbi:hypothetical protein CYMTET_52002 [Cymbomonas tetramitiformis]|uniref:Cyclic nucleotide-binding domain-containing protein n=1 Tax=Cymbomonas tetramitiformis TaxID=36881 RepID=A0AAE0ERI6_9CHLO|nr:hypothetical protein CYMTET_52002 [Cymbomonas tetramitiformis]